MKNGDYAPPVHEEGFAGLGDYAAIGEGEGQSVALIAPDGAIDRWRVPNLDSPPLFDRLLDSGIADDLANIGQPGVNHFSLYVDNINATAEKLKAPDARFL